MRISDIGFFLMCILTLTDLVQSCDIEQAHNGCKIQTGLCTCKFGCKSEYRYSSNQECQKALKARGTNICSRMPCMNNGSCIQISPEPGFKCRCGGTGFHGERCERICPSNDYGQTTTNIPYECIEI